MFSSGTEAQEKRWFVGAGLTYDSYMKTPGINLNVTYRLLANLHVGPDFSALLTKEETEAGRVVKRKELEYNFNASYLFKLSDRISIYPLTGVNWSKVTVHPEGEEAVKQLITALNAGGGFEFNVDPLCIFLESKFVSKLDKYALTVGLVFEL
ncbi:MAG: porin family protein [Flammeovirgaceae bacterium]|nr:porin family protein [Flammeovirgaceae bacterium]